MNTTAISFDSTDCDSKANPHHKQMSIKAMFHLSNIKRQPKPLYNDGEIPYTLNILWKQEMVVKNKITGVLKCDSSVLEDNKEIQKILWEDLHRRGIKVKTGAKMIARKSKRSEIIYTNVPKKGFPLAKCDQYQNVLELKIVATLIQTKINVPSGYTALPSKFIGNFAKNLCIGNEFGVIRWCSPVDVSNVDFSSGIDIFRQSVQIQQEALLTDVVVEFYQLPKALEKYVGLYDDEGVSKVEKKLRRSVEKEENLSCRFVGYDEFNSHWLLHLTLGKKKNDNKN